MQTETKIPEPPVITSEEMEECRKNNDYCPVLFAWYRYVGMLCNFYSRIQLDSPAVKTIEPVHYYVLIGLLNRCSRLMFSNVALSHEGVFGETTSIIDRCITESAIKISWLCHHQKADYFNRLLSDGLKTEIEFKKKIESAITNRGEPINIEKRMLNSIQNHINTAGLDESLIEESKRLPNMASMIDSLGFDRLMYTVSQRMGSHHIHGTWPSLRLHYLEENNGALHPRDHNCETHADQYVFISLIVLDAMKNFIAYICEDNEDITAFQKLPNEVEEKIMEINNEVIGKDFEKVKEI